MSTSPKVTGTNEGAAKKRAAKNATANEGSLFSINYDQEQVCDFTGNTESEDGVIFTTGTLNVGRTAIKILSSQLAEWERKERQRENQEG